MDYELREQLKPMCLFAKTVSAQVGISAFNVALEEYKAVIVMRQYGTTLSYLEVADQMVDVIEAQDYLDESQKESTKAMVVLAASLLSEFVDENFNVISNAD